MAVAATTMALRESNLENISTEKEKGEWQGGGEKERWWLGSGNGNNAWAVRGHAWMHAQARRAKYKGRQTVGVCTT